MPFSYILGGGVSGLILSYYLNIPIICEGGNLGGQLTEKEWHMGPRYLHVDEFSTKLLTDLNLPLDKEVIKIGYNMDGNFCEKNDEFRQKYYEKTRGSKKGFIPSSMSGGKSEFESYKINLQTVIQRLKEALFRKDHMLIPFNVKTINPATKKIVLDDGDNMQLEYDKLISTIPVTVFNKISTEPIHGDFRALKKTFILSESKMVWDYTYVYFAGEESYHRITCQDGNVVFEYTGKEVDMGWNEVDRAEMWTGQIIDSADKMEMEGIVFVGRYAEWRHNFLIGDAIKRALEMKNEN